MNTLHKQYDYIETLILKEGLRIQALDVHPELNVMTVILNTTAVLVQQLSDFKLLKNASKEQLLKYELINNGIGVHWPDLDEDLSLKGFLQNELRKSVKSSSDPIAA